MKPQISEFHFLGAELADDLNSHLSNEEAARNLALSLGNGCTMEIDESGQVEYQDKETRE